jgi:hypothetical protein
VSREEKAIAQRLLTPTQEAELVEYIEGLTKRHFSSHFFQVHLYASTSFNNKAKVLCRFSLEFTLTNVKCEAVIRELLQDLGYFSSVVFERARGEDKYIVDVCRAEVVKGIA